MDMKLFLGYIQGKQSNNFEMTSSMNERRSKSFLSPRSLNENEDNPVSRRARDYPNENDMGGGPPGDPIGFGDLNRYMKREGIISHGFILPKDIEIHGSPFNEDGTINSDHILVQIALETAQDHHGGKDRFKEFYEKLNAKREGRIIEDPLKKYLPYIRITPRMMDGEQRGHFIQVMDRPQIPDEAKKLNENEDNPVSRRARDYPNENDMRGGPYPSIVRGVERQFEREGIISQGVIHPEVIENHGSPFNEDGSIDSNHPSVRHSIERLLQHINTDNPLAHIRITPRVVDGRSLGYFISAMERPQSPPQSPPQPRLNEAKMKPTATDRANNRRIEQEARAAHLAAANAITSIPGARALKKYRYPHGPGQMFYGDEDPEHLSILAHLADKAPTITDPVAAIRLVAPHHGVDPEAAIAALPSSAPPQPPLNKARKVNPNFAREVEKTHIHVANAVTSVPGFQIPPEYPGYNNPEDPEHGSVMAHLKVVAPRLRNKVEAIKRVAKLHGVDPQAAIDALPSTAPMSLRDFMRALRR